MSTIAPPERPGASPQYDPDRSDIILPPRLPTVDFAVVEEILTAGGWIPIEAGSLERSERSIALFGSPVAVLQFLHPDGKAGAIPVAHAITVKPFVLVEPPAPRPYVAPPRIQCASPRCVNLVSRQGQHCATCCGPDCRHDEEDAITPEEKHEALFLADQYEKASARNGRTSEAFKLARMAQEQREIASRPVREAQPEPEVTEDVSPFRQRVKAK
jgi:hypothetical protein